jgi:hypothetical protein
MKLPNLKKNGKLKEETKSFSVLFMRRLLSVLLKPAGKKEKAKMKWTTKTFNMVHKSLQIIFVFLFFISIPCLTIAIEDQQVAIDINKMTFEESIAELSKIFDVEIGIVAVDDLPQHKFSFTLGQATFRQATKEAMRKAGLQNCVLIWNQKAKTARIWILTTGTAHAINSPDKYNNNMKIMTPEEFAALEPSESENFRMMTKEEYDHLEPETEESFRGITPEEFAELEPSESENFRMMTKEEYDRLEPETEDSFRGITPEEFAQLQQDE